MHFYSMLQLDTAILKQQIRTADNHRARYRALAALILKNVLCILFAVLFIAGGNLLFGTENSVAAVAIFCILMMVRFLDYGYETKSALLGLLLAFAILAVGPPLSALGGALWAFGVDFILLLALMLLTSYRPEYSNHTVYVLGYLLLEGSPVTGHALWLRTMELALGFLLCAGVFFRNHYKKQYSESLIDVLRTSRITEPRVRWQLKVCLGICLGMLVGRLIGLSRLAWVGIACMTTLQVEEEEVTNRLRLRPVYVVIGSALFGLLYPLCPPQLESVAGILSGICLGFCASYQWKTVFNSMGALLIATSLYGMGPAIILRILDNLFGVLFAFGFHKLYERIVPRLVLQDAKEKT